MEKRCKNGGPNWASFQLSILKLRETVATITPSRQTLTVELPWFLGQPLSKYIYSSSNHFHLQFTPITFPEVPALIEQPTPPDHEKEFGSSIISIKKASRKESPVSKEKKSSSTSKDASHSQDKPSGKSAYAKEPSHTVDDSRVQQDQEFNTGNNDKQPADKEVSKDDCQVARAKEPCTSYDELMDTSFDFSVFVLNRLNIKDLTQEILVRPAFELLKGTCKSLTELEYYLEEYHRGRQVIHQDFFINNDLEYLKGRDLSRRYLTFITKTKAATYEIKWNEDLVQNLFAANMSSSKDVYSRKRIIAVTRLTIMKKSRTVYTTYLDPKGLIYKDQINRNRLMHADELHKFSDGTMNDVRIVLYDIAKGIRMEYLPKRKWSRLDKRRARVMA
ncbi:hypothetical protein Tco_1360503 [Tanacetum coccineum]